MAEFGEQLRKAREAKEITQQTLAEKLYVTRQAVSRWECGDRYPDLITTKKISQILEVSIDDLLSENEMKVMAERNPIIDKPVINNVVIVLYAFAVFSFLITFVDILIRFPLQSSQIDYSDIQLIVINCMGLVLQMGIFLYGFIMALKGMLSPKKSGIVMLLFFVSVCLADSNHVFGSAGWQMTFMALLLIVPSVAGAIASYLYFCKVKYEKLCAAVIVIVSGWGIIRMIINTCVIVRHTSQFISMNTAVGLLLKLCIYLLFIYQVYTLSKKRKLAVMHEDMYSGL